MRINNKKVIKMYFKKIMIIKYKLKMKGKKKI